MDQNRVREMKAKIRNGLEIRLGMTDGTPTAEKHGIASSRTSGILRPA
jgi:hypothetical protein